MLLSAGLSSFSCASPRPWDLPASECRMALTLAWLVFPLLLILLCVGTGLLVERIAGASVPTALVLPLGLSVIIVVGSLTVSLPSTAKLTTPLVAALAAAGFVLSRGRSRGRPDR